MFTSRLALREGNSKKPIYQIHKWWARRLGSVFRTILLSATRSSRIPGDSEELFYQKNSLSSLVVLDPFVGGGTSLVEAAKCGANVIGVDIDPVACFITAKELAPFDEAALRAAFQRVQAKVKHRIAPFYRTTLPDGRHGSIINAFWVDEIQCPSCKEKIRGHPHYQLYRNQGAKKQTVICAHCGTIEMLGLHRVRHTCRKCVKVTEIKAGPISNGRFHCPTCQTTTVLRDLTEKNKRIPQRLFALEVLIDGTKERIYKAVDDGDRALQSRKVGLVPPR